jgi:hypothetical protein
VAVFEDVHWADDATLDLLRFLGRRLSDTRTLAIATFRRDELGPHQHPLRVVLGDLASAPAVHRVRVSPLSRDAVARLAEGVDVDPDELHRITAGNPFFVTEVVAAGGERLPTSVSDAVNARVGRLPGAARDALEAASVLGLTVEPNPARSARPWRRRPSRRVRAPACSTRWATASRSGTSSRGMRSERPSPCRAAERSTPRRWQRSNA